ncbi:carotenoid oxygenase [Fennellomyces sp. T-0311]|nr:carotenoid oxygenase [Fennellomyces sp. T-0311]
MLQFLIAVIAVAGSYKLVRAIRTLFQHVNQIKQVQQGNLFQNAQEVSQPIWMPVEKGVIPNWLSGIMYRIGPGKYNLDGKVMIKHAFDGLPFMHRFEISPERQAVRYNSRNLSTSVERQLVQERAKSAVFFGHVQEATLWDRCMAPVKRFKQVFGGISDTQNPSSAMVGVTVTPNYPVPSDWLDRSKDTLGDYHLVSKTDLNLLQQVHANTLEPKRIYKYGSYDKRLDGDLSAAHHQYDPVTQEIFNFTIKFGPVPKLTVFSISRSGQVSILAEITHRRLPDGAQSRIRPSYIHSFMLTQSHVIIPEYPLYYHGADILLSGNAVGSYKWDEESPTYFHIISRRQDIGHIITLPADSFFSFHNCNAWDFVDENGDPGILLDTCAFADADIIYQLHSFGTYLRRPVGESKVTTQTRPKGISMPPIRQPSFGDLRRYKLTWKRDLDQGSVAYTNIASNIEFARFSQHYALLQNQFAWACQLISPKTEKEAERYILVKIHLETGAIVAYNKPRHSCSEPIFVPKSADGNEDEGAVISLVNVVGEKGPEQDSSFLLILDAASMEEIARCSIGPYNISTFHGSYINSDFENVSMN